MQMKKILVIEDNKDILENTAEILELSHYHVFAAANGKEGIEKALASKPDLILCDIMMPELDGYGVLHMVQHNPELQNTPFIFLTAKTEKEEVRRGMSLGADDYITKPFDPTDLLNAIEGRLKKAETIRQQTAVLGSEGAKAAFPQMAGAKVLLGFLDGRDVDVFKKKQRIFPCFLSQTSPTSVDLGRPSFRCVDFFGVRTAAAPPRRRNGFLSSRWSRSRRNRNHPLSARRDQNIASASLVCFAGPW